jgi:hypothetical protein
VIIVAMLLAVSSASCPSQQDIDRRDYKKLKTVMLRISKAPDDMLAMEVQRLRSLQLDSKKIAEIRDSCAKAYAKVILASSKSREADAILDKMEKDASGTIDTVVILEMKQEATTLLNESNALLKEAEALKDDCYGRMEDMEKPQNR